MTGAAATNLTPQVMVGAVVATATSIALIISLGYLDHRNSHIVAAGLVFGAVAFWLRRRIQQVPLWFILLVTLCVQLPGLFHEPITSTDAFRYVWDGRVQLAGIDPYRYVPLDPALVDLRDEVLFPPDRTPRIGRPTVPTIYPPYAQLWFMLVAVATPWSWGTFGVQLGAMAAVLVTTYLLARFLGKRRGTALLYGGSPMVMLETANGAHLDALGSLLVFGLGWAAVHHRRWLAGVFLGLAVGVKLVPLLLFPAFLRHGRWRTSLLAIGTAIVGYVPHLLVVGSLVVGFLPAYVVEEGFDGSRRFAVLIWLPESWRPVVGLVLALTVAVVAWVRSKRDPVLVTCCWLYGGAFLVASPYYPWYALPLVVLSIMARRLEWLSVWAALYVSVMFVARDNLQALAWGVAVLVVGVVAIWRSIQRRRGVADPTADPSSKVASPSH